MLVEKIFESGTFSYKTFEKKVKMKMKNEEEKNKLLLELLYIYNFSIKESSIES